MSGSCHRRSAAAQVQTLESASLRPGTTPATRGNEPPTLATSSKEVTAMVVRKMTAMALAVAIEAVLIVSVVLSTIGVSPAWHPTPGGAAAAGLPAPTASGELR